MSHLGSTFSNDGNVLFNESVGSHHLDDEYVIYDSDSGKYYRTTFDLEQAFWASKYYESGSPPDPIEVVESLPFTPTPMVFKPCEV